MLEVRWPREKGRGSGTGLKNRLMRENGGFLKERNVGRRMQSLGNQR